LVQAKKTKPAGHPFRNLKDDAALIKGPTKSENVSGIASKKNQRGQKGL